MAEPARKKKNHQARHLKAVPSEPEGRSVGGLFSGKVTRPPARAKRKKARKPEEELQGEVAKLADLYAAGKTVQKEVEFKTRYAEQRVKDFCVHRFAELYASTGKRPPSIDYLGPHSRFTFIQTDRTFLTLDKADELKAMNIPIDEYTELRGIRINYEAIRRHGIEKRLQEAVAKMGLPEQVMEDCFAPDVQLKESFFEILDNVVRESLQKGENLAEKIYEVIRVLNSANQVRSLEAPGEDAKQCFNLVLKTEIVPEEEEEGPGEEPGPGAA